MGLFGKKSKKEDEEKKKAAEAAAGEQAAEEAGEPKAAKVRPETFSARAAGIFGRMYRLVISVNLVSNVCQIESGDRVIFGRRCSPD